MPHCWQTSSLLLVFRLCRWGSCVWLCWASAQRWSALMEACVTTETPAAWTQREDTDAVRCLMWVNALSDFGYSHVDSSSSHHCRKVWQHTHSYHSAGGACLYFFKPITIFLDDVAVTGILKNRQQEESKMPTEIVTKCQADTCSLHSVSQRHRGGDLN